MGLKTAIKVALVLLGISILLILGLDVSNIDGKSLLVGSLFLPTCFVLLIYIPSLFVMMIVKLFPGHEKLRYLPAVLAVNGLLFFIHKLFFGNSVNKGLDDIVGYIFLAMVCIITSVSSFIVAKNTI